MSNKNGHGIYKLNPWRIIKIYGIGFLIFEAIFYLTFQGAVNSKLWPLDKSFYFYTPLLLAATVIFVVMSIKQTYYEIDGTKLIHVKMGKIVDYTWANIIYVDEEFSEKKKMMRFFTKDGTEHLLAFDKEGQIYNYALQKCSLISREEFERRFPGIKM